MSTNEFGAVQLNRTNNNTEQLMHDIILKRLLKIEDELRIIEKTVKDTNNGIKHISMNHTDYTYVLTYGISIICLTASIIVIGFNRN